ncbi:MAG: 4Fe-4S binding protein [Oscillospiraceae bacterium]|nr:4Fe-4S binding protein [Oscillospiraceae bacterium]
MKRVYINEKWCLGCRLCEYYCAFAEKRHEYNNMALALKDTLISPRIRVEEYGDITFAVNCRRCEEPLCVKSCITGALTADGIDKDRCVSCCTCILACPFGAVSLVDNVIKRCDLCNGEPLCVKACPNNALVFEDRRCV